MSNNDQHHTRREYLGGALHRSDLDEDPFVQFERWLADVIEFGSKDATAMALATADTEGVPSVRTVLMKKHGPEGFTWYTDARSRKGRELAVNPCAELLFYWRDLDRQVRIHGSVEQLPAADAESYFHSRPVGNRFSTAVSEQSSIVADRSQLENEIERLERRYPDGDVPRPEAWLGYRLTAERFEFWQGRESRLHDRFSYTPESGGWRIERLGP